MWMTRIRERQLAASGRLERGRCALNVNGSVLCRRSTSDGVAWETASRFAAKAGICRAGAVLQQSVPYKTDAAKRQARPHGHAEIQRHPRNFIFPVNDVMRHRPAVAQVMQAREKSEQLFSACDIRLPAAEVHRHVDGDEKRQIAGNTGNRCADRNSSEAMELVHEPQQAGRDEQESHRP
jgi:hypothetical protein